MHVVVLMEISKKKINVIVILQSDLDVSGEESGGESGDEEFGGEILFILLYL